MRWTYDDVREKPGIGMWLVQVLIAGLFLFAGIFKLTMSPAALAQASGLPGSFMHLIATFEVLGALGLVLPGLFHIHEELTPIAACGLVLIMIGAVTDTVARMPVANAILPCVTGVLAGYIVYRRRRQLRRLFAHARTPRMQGVARQGL